MTKQLSRSDLRQLAKQLDGAEPISLTIATRKRTFVALLTSVELNGKFEIYQPTEDGDLEQRTYYIDDVVVYLED